LNVALQSLLNVPAEVVGLAMVDPAVHEAEAVGRTDYRIAVDFENRTMVNRNAWKITAESLPSFGKLCFHCCKYDVEHRHRSL
jgi:hypothetical protein